MTHAIYIAAILVLAGVACWLWRSRQDKIDELSECYFSCAHEAQAAQEWQEIAEKHSADLLERGGQYDALRGILNDTERELGRDSEFWERQYDELIQQHENALLDLESAQSSNRSLRGWNGRYRRKIAALEAELADERVRYELLPME